MLSELFRRNEVLAWMAVAHLGLFLLAALLSAFDARQLNGINIWIKPMKFALSVALYTGTFGWLYHHANAPATTKLAVSWVIAATLIFEILCIYGQAARGVASHFNISTPTNALIFSAMGLVILVNMAAAAVGAWHFFQTPPTADLSPAYLWGIRLGLVIFILAGLEGGVMGSKLQHAVGVKDGGPGLPFLNWSTEGGDLRTAHFVGMHALQALPLLGYLLGSVPIILLSAAAWAGTTLWLLLRALAGKPLVG